MAESSPTKPMTCAGADLTGFRICVPMDARVGNVFPYRAWPHRFQEVARLKPKTSIRFWKSAQASFVLTILFINILHALPPIWKQLRAGHHMFDHSGGGRAMHRKLLHLVRPHSASPHCLMARSGLDFEASHWPSVTNCN